MNKKYVGNRALSLGALLSVVTSLHQAGWKLDAMLLVFEVWIAFPYFLCWLLNRPLYKSTNSKFPAVAFAFSLLVLLYSVFAYSSFYYGRQSSTGGIALIFIPLYLTLASILVLGTANAVRLFQDRRENDAA